MQHFHKQHQTEIGRKNKQILSNAMRRNSWLDENKSY